VSDPFDGEELRAALRTGEPDRLRAGFERHYEAMSRLVRPLVASQQHADRVIEAAWVDAVRRSAELPGRESARAWLFARLLDALDRMPALRSDEPADAGDAGTAFCPPGDPWEGHWAEFPAPWRAEPPGWEHTRQGRAALDEVVQRLPPLERTLLILRDLDGWSAAEVAALTELLPEEQRRGLHRARLAVRASLDDVLREPAQPAGLPQADQPGGTRA
jgi:RNA polymerase sigma-70 factor (ECF subfamily)